MKGVLAFFHATLEEHGLLGRDDFATASFSVLHALSMRLAGLAWSFSLLMIEPSYFTPMVVSSLKVLGNLIDEKRLQAPPVIPRREDTRLASPDSVPLVPVVTPGLMVVAKPSGWEIDGATTDGNLWTAKRLSLFLQAMLSAEAHPLNYAAELNYGFIHRLDVLSSGLVLCGTSFRGFYWIQYQLSTHAICRHYFVTAHEMFSAGLWRIDAKVDPGTMAFQKSRVAKTGKPSLSYVRLFSHSAAPCVGRPKHSVISVHIHTGRRHQIRVHMQHVGHSPVADAGYPSRSAQLFLSELYQPFPAFSPFVPGHPPLEAHDNASSDGMRGFRRRRATRVDAGCVFVV